ncbi:MAG TPA: glycosyltransferase family 2 protein [Candidatus Methylomirabilis sp.]|nr:glycosyltransferase family 2 protein [Candidatus Methylomirabilis sp.]
MKQLSVIIPAYNEEDGIRPTIERLRAVASFNAWDMEILVVDDGSGDKTGEVARSAGASVIRNPVNGGYGLSLQRGIRAARHKYVAITDADGTYPVEELPQLVAMMDEGLDMAVGARQGSEYKQSWWKHPARIVFRVIAEFVAGRKIPDINSGLRVMRRSVLLPYLERTCMGFSFTTSITLILMLNGQFVAYRPIPYARRIGNSKIRHFRDTLRTAQIMTSIIAAHNPIKLGIMVDLMLVAIATVATVVALLVNRVPISSVLVIFALAMLASTPIVFMLGCLGELLRTRVARNHHGT